MPISDAIVPRNDQATIIEEAEAPSLSLRDFLGILRRRKLIALNVFVLIVALGVVSTLMSKPVFQSGARLLVEGRASGLTLTDSRDPLGDIFQGSRAHAVETQVEVLRSPLVLDQVFKEANLPLGSVGVAVKRVEETDVIDLTATAPSRAATEQFITTLPKVYERITREDRLREVKASLEFARRSLKEDNAKLQRTEAALEAFKNRAGVVDPAAESAEALAAAAQARTDQRKAEADVSSLRGNLDALIRERHILTPFIDAPVTTTNPQVAALRDQIATLQSERTKQLFLYKPTDDEVRKVDVQIADLQRRLASTPANVTNTSRTLNPAIAAADAKVADARASLEAASANLNTVRARAVQLSQGLTKFNGIARTQGQLQRDLLDNTQAVTTLSQSVTQLTLREKALESAGSPVTTIETGGPAVQIAPKPARNLILALALGALLAAAAAMLQESLDDHVRDEEEARRLLNVPVLGYFPFSVASKGRPLLNMTNPNRVLLEQFRVLRSNVQFTLVNSPGKKLLVTSSAPEEGKSYVCSNLAVAMALDGRRVILVDTDLHRPKMHEVFDLPRQPGLTNVLVGQASLESALQETGIPGLRLMAAGALPPNPVELLNSPAMDAVFERLEQDADVVLFDSPPLLATADSQVMASKVDGVLYVMQMGRMSRSALLRSFELLRQARARVIGMALNKVDEKRHHDEYGGYNNYYQALDEGAPVLEVGGLNGANGGAASSTKNGANGSSWLTRGKGRAASNGAESAPAASVPNGASAGFDDDDDEA